MGQSPVGTAIWCRLCAFKAIWFTSVKAVDPGPSRSKLAVGTLFFARSSMPPAAPLLLPALSSLSPSFSSSPPGMRWWRPRRRSLRPLPLPRRPRRRHHGALLFRRRRCRQHHLCRRRRGGGAGGGLPCAADRHCSDGGDQPRHGAASAAAGCHRDSLGGYGLPSEWGGEGRRVGAAGIASVGIVLYAVRNIWSVNLSHSPFPLLPPPLCRRVCSASGWSGS